MPYPDWQQIVEWDGGALINDQAKASPYSSATVPIGSFQSSVLWLAPSGTSQWRISVSWVSSLIGGLVLGTRSFMIDTNLTTPAQFRLPNLGPFVILSATRISGLGTITAVLLPSNRNPPWEVAPAGPFLINANLGPGAGAVLTTLPFGYWAGPVECRFAMAAQVGVFSLSYCDTGAGAYIDYTADVTSAGGTVVAKHITPTGAWRASVHNLGGVADTATIVIVPSLTGST